MCWCCRTSRSTALFIKMKCIIHKILPFLVYCRSTPELAQSSPLNRGVGSFPFSSMEAETMVSPLARVQCPFLPQCPWPREDVPLIARLPHVRAFTHASFPISKWGESRQKDSHSISHAGKLICFRNWFLSSRVADTWTSLQTEAFPVLSLILNVCYFQLVICPLACETTIQESKNISAPLGHFLLTFFADYLWSSGDHFFAGWTHRLRALCLSRSRPALAGPSDMPEGEVLGYRILAWLPGLLNKVHLGDLRIGRCYNGVNW